MNTRSNKKISCTVGATLLPALAFPAATAQQETVFSNAIFNTLLVAVVLLLIVILALAQVLKNLGQSDLLYKKNDNSGRGNGNSIKAAGVLILCITALHSSAGTAAAKPDHWYVGGLDMTTFYFLMGIIVLELIMVTVLLRTILGLIKTTRNVVQAEHKKEKSLLEKLNASVAIEEEKDILMDHDYDGIRELDNDLPPWWKYGFYLTIAVAVAYLVHYHITKTGDLQITEYNKEVQKGKEESAAFLKNTASDVDENSVKMLPAADIESGKNLFVTSCSPCHGKLGEGIVGPNLTDDYWIHGGSISDIFKSIKYGWADKGMKSWKEDFSPIQIAQLSSFIKSLKGTNPPNAKAQQGEAYTESDNSGAPAEAAK